MKTEQEIRDKIGAVYSDERTSYEQAASWIDALCWVLGVDMSAVVEEEKMDTITLRHLPGSCCPEKDCGVGSWDGKHCRSCGADCSKCPQRSEG